MKLNSFRLEFKSEDPSGGVVEVFIDGDGEVTKVDIGYGEIYPDDLADAVHKAIKTWSAITSAKL